MKKSLIRRYLHSGKYPVRLPNLNRLQPVPTSAPLPLVALLLISLVLLSTVCIGCAAIPAASSSPNPGDASGGPTASASSPGSIPSGSPGGESSSGPSADPNSSQPSSPASLSAAIAQMTSPDDLKALYAAAIAAGRLDEAYQAGQRLTVIAPDNQDGYIMTVTALLAMSRGQYQTINGLLAQAMTAVPDPGQLIAAIRQQDSDLAIDWPFLPDTTAPEALNMAGNSCGNMSAGGLVAVQGKWAYFSNQADQGKLYKIQPTEPTGRQKICDDAARFINVIGDTIYYCNTSDGDALYSIRTDGAQRTKLLAGQCEFISVENGWIYFGGLAGKQPALFKIRTDGREKTRLLAKLTKYPYIKGDWVYYVSKLDNGTLWRMPASGGQARKIVSDLVYFYTIDGDQVYYLADVRGRLAICRMNLDGSAKQQVYTIAGKISTFNVYGKLLFVSVRPESNNRDEIVVFDLDTQKILKKIDFFSENLFVADRLLLYAEYGDNRLHRVDLNNWNETKIDE